jgi:hypothetical protein
MIPLRKPLACIACDHSNDLIIKDISARAKLIYHINEPS